MISQTFYLRDYLRPGGTKNYDDLPRHLEDSLAAGHQVSLLSVPGFMMLFGRPDPRNPKPWLRNGEFYATAAEALKI